MWGLSPNVHQELRKTENVHNCTGVSRVLYVCVKHHHGVGGRLRHRVCLLGLPARSTPTFRIYVRLDDRFPVVLG